MVDSCRVQRLTELLQALRKKLRLDQSGRSFARWLGVQNSTVLRWERGQMQIRRVGEEKIAQAIGRTQSEVHQYLDGLLALEALLDDKEPIQSRQLKQSLEQLGRMQTHELWEVVHAALELIRQQPASLPKLDPPDATIQIDQQSAGLGLSQAEQLQLLKDFLNSVSTRRSTGEYSLAEVAEILGHSDDGQIFQMVKKLNGSNGKPQQQVKS